MDYRPIRKPSWPVLEEAWKIRETPERIQFLLESNEAPGRFLWRTLSALFLYAAARIPEVTNDIVSVDTTMRAGFNWEMGIFEIWSRLGLEDTVRRMRREGQVVPPLVECALATPEKAYYAEKGASLTVFDLSARALRPHEDPPGVLRLSSRRRLGAVVKSNPGASLLELGDGIVCFELHSKANTLDGDVLQLLEESLADVEARYDGLVIGHEGANFCVGANLWTLLEFIREGRWEDLGEAVTATQNVFRSLRQCSKPAVAAVFGQTLAGGCEMALHSRGVQAGAETYMGLVETGAGLIPAAGGCTEMLRRFTSGLNPASDLTPATRQLFETIGRAKVSGSGLEAREWRLLRPGDGITMNRDRLLADAQRLAIALSQSSEQLALDRSVLVGGRDVLAALRLDLYLGFEAGMISEYDVHIGNQLAYVLSGGELSQPGRVSEEYLLGLEKEAFLSLCGEEKTQQRIEHLLKAGKALRN
jgi:3-hydroxyacyl-CoA dehydrogenase